MRSLTARRSTIAIALALAVSAGLAVAQPYKWTDKDGRVHYSDKPPVGSTATQVQPRVGSVTGSGATGTAPTAKPAAAQTMAEKEQAFRKRQVDGRETEQKQAKLDEQNKQKIEACRNARSRMAGLEAGGRQVRFNEKGERTFLDDAQITQERSSVQRDISSYCS
jgi:Domain of unknown function (DUF4124)